MKYVFYEGMLGNEWERKAGRKKRRHCINPTTWNSCVNCGS